MERQSNKTMISRRVISFALALIMMFSVIGIMPEAVSAAEKTLPAKGGTVSISDAEAIEIVNPPYYTTLDNWIMYKPKADGYLKLVVAENKSNYFTYPNGSLQLYNNNKNKILSQVTDFWTEETKETFKSDWYGVKKNTTYYIRVRTNGSINIKATFKKVKDGATKQSKAANMKAKKVTKGIVKAGDTKARWYKFKLSKPAKLSCFIKPYLTGDVRVTLKGPGKGNSGSVLIQCKEYNSYDQKVYANRYGQNYNFYKSNALLKAGQYYMKIQPTTKTCTGYYELKWK